MLEAGEADGRLYLVMEVIEGNSLEQRLREHGPLPLSEVAAVLAGLGPAVDALHAAGLVHRDISAANVLVEAATGRVVLGDFGIARALAHTGRTTETGVVGSWQYLAPERWQGDPGGPATDIYALGVLAYRLLTGQPPFTGDAAALAYAHLHQPPPPLPSLRPDLPARVAGMIEQALAKQPGTRPARATDLAVALSDAESAGAPATEPTERLGPTAAVTTLRIQTRRAHHWPLGLVVAGAGALAGVILLTGVLANRVSFRAPETLPSPAAATRALPEPETASLTPVEDSAPPPSSAAATTSSLPDVTQAPAATAAGVADPSPAPVVPPVTAPPATARVTATADAPAVEAPKHAEEQSREAQKRVDEQAREARKRAEEQDREARKKAEEQQREDGNRDD
jgi:serine/threonine-protein kinase